MKDDFSQPSYIIVLGTTYSGSGAVYDYLSGRKDLHDPLGGIEYQLPQMPNGLMALEAVSKNAFHPATADFVLTQFENIINKLSRSRKFWRYGKDYSRMMPLFKKGIEEFLNEISVTKFSMRWHWHRLMKSETILMFIANKLKNRIGFEDPTPKTRLIVSSKEFIVAAQKLHNKIFHTESLGRSILLNQAGSGWNPLESTKYFINRKVILVNRDPRDQFVEIKHYKKATSINGFIEWYKEMQIRLGEINSSCLLKIQFEEFVNKNDLMKDFLCDQLSINSNVNSSYKPDLSKKNIGKYKKFLSIKEIDIIEKKLADYIY